MPTFIDTHCHIDTILERLGGTAEALFECMNPAPEAIIHVACDPKDFNWGGEFLSRKTINGVKIYGAFGVHPLLAESFCEQAEREIFEYLKLPGALALGEIGLDYHYSGYSPDLQKKVFLRQIEMGLELNKPFVFHLREAEDDAFEILRKIDSENLKVHIHCYTGTANFAEKVLSLKGNYFFGFTGAITFDKTATIREAAAAIPLNKILLETDAPYLAPVPFRGKICTPAMIPNIAQVLANIKKVPLDELFKICKKNTEEMYKLSTLNSQLSTPNSQLSTLNSQLPTLNSQLSTLNSQLPTLNSQLPTLNSQLSTLNSQLPTLNSQLSTLNSQLSTPNSQLPTLNSQLPTNPPPRPETV